MAFVENKLYTYFALSWFWGVRGVFHIFTLFIHPNNLKTTDGSDLVCFPKGQLPVGLSRR